MLTTLGHQLRNYYTLQHPERDNLQIEELKQLASGWASDVYSFTLKYEENGVTSRERLVLKTYAPNMDGIDRALKERHALYNLRAAKYPVPGVALVEVEMEHLERPFIVMEQVDGHLMWDEFQEADGQRRQELIKMFVGLLVDLHDLGAKVLVSKVNELSKFALIKREIFTMRGLITNHDLPEFSPVADWLYEHCESVPCNTPVVTHRDYHPWNVMLTDTGRPFVIDWGWQLSDPRYDLAWTLTLMARSGFDTFRDAALAEYERIKGGEIEGLDYFEVVATLRWLLNVIYSARSGEDLRSDAREEFRSFITEPVRRASALIHERTGIELPPVEQLLAV